MLLNYLKLSLRLLVRNPFFTFINVLGLSVGFAAFFILWQYSTIELQSDQHHRDYKRIARIGAYWRWMQQGQGGEHIWGNLMAYQTGMIFSDFPQIEEHCRFITQAKFRPEVVGLTSNIVMEATQPNQQQKMFREAKLIMADPNLFEFFNVPLLQGDRETVLRQPNAVVISHKTAVKYFGNESPMGSLLNLNDTIALTVTGVFEDLPRSTHLNFDIVLSNIERVTMWDDPLFVSFTETYIKLHDIGEIKNLTSQLNLRYDRYWSDVMKTRKDCSAEMYIQPLEEIAFTALEDQDFIAKSSGSLVLLKVVSVLILMMAWINYMNLAFSRLMKRLKEIATRKVSGAQAKDFIKQFLIESLVINGISLTLAFTFIQLVGRMLNELFEIPVPDFFSISWVTWVSVLGFIFLGILIIAVAIATISIQYNPRRLQSLRNTSRLKNLLSSTLYTIQYGTASVLVLWAFVVFSQLTYLLDKDILNMKRILIVEAPHKKGEAYLSDANSFLNDLRKYNPATFSNSIIGDEAGVFVVGMKLPQHSSFQGLHCDGGVDENFIPFYGIKMLAGRNFVSNDRGDVILISRIASKRMGFQTMESAVGTKAVVNALLAAENQNPTSEVEIIGVYEDYPLDNSLSSNPKEDKSKTQLASCLIFKTGPYKNLLPERFAIQTGGRNVEPTVTVIRESFMKLFPGSLFTWYFLDDHINRAYDHEKIVRNQITLYTGLAVAIACLGLLGMIANRIEEKVKEIGIRKVMGADVYNIGSVLLSTTFRQMLVAIVISLPFSFYLANDYLRRFTDRIDLQWWHFALPVAILVSIMLGTIASMLLRALKTNPVESLRYE